MADRDGAVLTQFNSAGGLPGSLVWSPDGARLAWTEELTLYVADPSNPNPILTIPDVYGASWSNDTAFPRRLAYGRLVFGQNVVREVWVVGEDGSGATRLASDAWLAEWSPDDTTIAFYRDDGVWLTSANGTNPRLVVPDGESFRWSQLPNAFGGPIVPGRIG